MMNWIEFASGMGRRLAALAAGSLLALGAASGDMGPNLVTGDRAAPHRGVYELRFVAGAPLGSPYAEPAPTVVFERPDGSKASVDCFVDGDEDGKPVYGARAYCDQAGAWKWTLVSESPALDKQRGEFNVVPSALPGKLRKHPDDPHQFAYDNGEWFLHIGDTGYRYVTDTEPEWQAYIDQAVQMGATKIRTWFCRSRGGVEALFTEDRGGLNLSYWQEIDRRVQYALNTHPRVMLQLIPYGEDGQELKRYAAGDAMSRLAARHAQARWSAFPNVLWCISNDQKIVGEDKPVEGERVPASAIEAIGKDMAAREPWGTLLTNHQARYSGYAFAAAPWSDIVTLEDKDQVEGAILTAYREKADDPVVNEEDRYEMHERPEHPPYYFRRLMWASLLSGGHATYGGSRTYEAYNGKERGVRGYFDLNREGILRGGADSFVHIHAFFKETGLTLAGMRPDDALAGGNPRAAKVIANGRTVLVYLPNADAEAPELANAARTRAGCELRLAPGEWSLRWFHPSTGKWADAAQSRVSGGDTPCRLTAPFEGDAVAWAQREGD